MKNFNHDKYLEDLNKIENLNLLHIKMPMSCLMSINTN